MNLFETETKSILAQGGIEKIGLKGSFLKLTLPDGEKVILEKDIPEHTVGIEFILDTLVSKEYGCTIFTRRNQCRRPSCRTRRRKIQPIGTHRQSGTKRKSSNA